MEGTATSDFMRLSEDVAKKFLHTVVVVDDNAYFGEKPMSSELQSPGRGKPIKEERADVGRKRYGLNAKEVIDSFAAKGIVCSFLKPSESEEFSLLMKISRRADAFILDWEIKGDNGRAAKETISRIIRSDLREKPRLRLLLIYTIENDVDSISEAMKEVLKSVFAERYNESEDNGATLTHEYLRIAIFLKDPLNVAPEYEDRVLNPEQLTERLHLEFAKITAGLVSNVALDSMSILRDNTHQILGKLGPDIDPPYLAHRALLRHPEDAKGHVLEIISSEFHSLLENSNAGERANIDAIMSWLEMKNDSAHFKVKVGADDKKMKFDEMRDVMKKGIENADWYGSAGSNKQKRKIYKDLTTTFCFDDEDGHTGDCKYSLLTTLKQRYEGDQYIPKLTLGTIVKTVYKNEYWFCIQPRCDSVRIEKERNFFFLPLKIVEDENDGFDLVIDKGKNDFVKLKINYSVYDIEKFTFRPGNDDHQKIMAKKVTKSLIFESIDGARFRYMAEMKTEQAQRVANNFASELSRVGLDEYEWLRRWANRRD